MIEDNEKNWKEAPDWMIRVGQEWKELGERITKLEKFLDDNGDASDKPDKVMLSDSEFTLLLTQLSAMTTYEKILEARMMYYGFDPVMFPVEWMKK